MRPPPIESLSPADQQVVRTRRVAMRVHTVLLCLVFVLSIPLVIGVYFLLKPWQLDRSVMSLIVDLGLLVPAWCYLFFTEFELREHVTGRQWVRFIGGLVLLTGGLTAVLLKSALFTLVAVVAAALFGLLVGAACYSIVQFWRGIRR